MKKKNKAILIWIAIIGVIALGIYLVRMQQNKPGQYDDFAKCLTEKGARMYGTEWCSHCQAQKAAFGKSFQYVFFTDCDLDTASCSGANVTGYPTWIINGTQYQGRQELAKLGSLTSCNSFLVK